MQDIEQIIWDGAVQRSELIADRSFGILTDLKVLEIGFLNTLFSKKILEKTSDLTAIDLDPTAISYMAEMYPQIKCMEYDMHEFVKIPEYYDAVVVYGVLYHSPCPLIILEDIANNIKPKFMLLETLWQGHNDRLIASAPEQINFPGSRWVGDKKHCGVALNISQILLEQVMPNLGYELVNKFTTGDIPGYTDIYTNYKPGGTWCYTNWKLI
jgi:hypothetical protein